MTNYQVEVLDLGHNLVRRSDILNVVALLRMTLEGVR